MDDIKLIDKQEKIWKFRNHRRRNRSPCDYCKSRKRCCERIDKSYCKRCLKAGIVCTYGNSTSIDNNSHNKPNTTGFISQGNARKAFNTTNNDITSIKKEIENGAINMRGIECGESLLSIKTTQNLTKRGSSSNFEGSERGVPLKVSSPGTQDLDILYLNEISETFGNKLIKLYIVFVNPLLPVISWNQFHDFIIKDGPHKWKSFPLILLGSVYLQAIRYWSNDKSLKLTSPPDTDRLFLACFRLTMKKYEKIANDPEENSILLQSCLLQIPHAISKIDFLDNNSEIVSVSKLLEISHYLVENLKLGVNFLKKNLNNIFRKDSECFVLNNIWWVYYIEEKWFTILTNRRSSVGEVNFDFIEDFDSLLNLAYVETKIRDFDTGNDFSKAEEYILQLNYAYRPYFVDTIKITIICSEITNYWYSIVDFKFEKYGIKENFQVIIDILRKSNLFMEKIDHWWDNIHDSLKGEKNLNFKRYTINAGPSLQLFFEIAKVMVFKILFKKFILFSLIVNSSEHTIEDQEIMMQFLELYQVTKFKLLDYFKHNCVFLKSVLNREEQLFWYPFTNFHLSFLVIFLSLVNFSLKTDSDHSANNDKIMLEIELIIANYRELLGNGSKRWKFMKLPLDIIKKLIVYKRKETSYEFIDRFKFSGILNDHAIEHLLINNLPECIIFEKEEEAKKMRELEFILLNDLNTIEMLNNNIEEFLTDNLY